MNPISNPTSSEITALCRKIRIDIPKAKISRVPGQCAFTVDLGKAFCTACYTDSWRLVPSDGFPIDAFLAIEKSLS